MLRTKALAILSFALAFGGCAPYAPEQVQPSFSQTAGSSAWIPISVALDGSATWELQRGSLLFGKNTDGEPIGVANGRVLHAGGSQIELLRWHVTARDCARGVGKIGMSNTSDVLLAELDFAFEGGTHASRIAQAICEAADIEVKKISEQSGRSGGGIANDGSGI